MRCALTTQVNDAKAASMRGTNEWAECLRISELPDVDESIRNLIADPTEDNAACLVRDIVRANLRHREHNGQPAEEVHRHLPDGRWQPGSVRVLQGRSHRHIAALTLKAHQQIGSRQCAATRKRRSS